MNFVLLAQLGSETSWKEWWARSLTIIGHKIEPIYTWGNVFEIKVLKIPVRCWERHGDAVFRT